MNFRDATVIVTALALASGGCALRKKKAPVAEPAPVAAPPAMAEHAMGSTVKAAIVGAAVGGAAGAIIGHRLDVQAEKLRQSLKNATVSRVGEGIAVTFESGSLFTFGSSRLQPAGRENLRLLAARLKEEPRTEIVIVGHTDSVGNANYNQGLSERRAVAAANDLSARGIRRRRVWTSGKGEAEPVGSNDTEPGRQRNRRVEIAIFASDEWRQAAQREAAAERK
jgi:outer membrane protein OmpA-like peptidoglycan-associated protein